MYSALACQGLKHRPCVCTLLLRQAFTPFIWLAYNLPFMMLLQAPNTGADMRQNTLRKMFPLCTERRAWRKISPLDLRETMV